MCHLASFALLLVNGLTTSPQNCCASCGEFGTCVGNDADAGKPDVPCGATEVWDIESVDGKIDADRGGFVNLSNSTVQSKAPDAFLGWPRTQTGQTATLARDGNFSCYSFST